MGVAGRSDRNMPGVGTTEQMMRRYAAVTDQRLRKAAEAVSGAEVQESSSWESRARASEA